MKRKLLAILLIASLALSPLAGALASSPAEVSLTPGADGAIHIRSTEELAELSRRCVLDTWSQGVTVLLEKDLSLSSSDFTPIPVFRGTFDGQDHTISGLRITGSGSMRGLFRVIETDGLVQNLNVSGTLNPSGLRDEIGGIAGRNSGQIQSCAFSGTIKGASEVGGIAGVNTTSGQIINCSMTGTLTGEHSTGGIVGENQGSVLQCTNEASVNTTEVKSEVGLGDLNLEQINTTENVPACTDVGGIAGLSTGILQSCVNHGDVGYAHTGYNIGGIAGRQSGSLDGCENDGTILGRKDVGGIAGQLEPQVTLQYSESDLDALWNQLDTLQGLLDRTLNSASGNSRTLTGHVSTLTDDISGTRDALSSLADGLTDWTDSATGQLEDVSARISWTLDQVGPILEQVEGAGSTLEDAVSRLDASLEEAKNTGELAGDAADLLTGAVKDLRSALERSREAIGTITDGLEDLRSGLGGASILQTTLDKVGGGFSDLGSSVSDLADAVARLKTGLAALPAVVQNTEAGKKLLASLDNLHGALVDMAAAQEKIHGALSAIATAKETQDGFRQLAAAVQDLANAAAALQNAHTDFDAALAALEGRQPSEALTHARAGMTDLRTAVDTLAQASKELNDVMGNLQSDTIQTNLKTLREGLDSLSAAMGRSREALAGARTALEELEQSPEWQAAVKDVQNQLDAISPALDSAGQAVESAGRALEQLADAMSPEEIEDGMDALHAALDTLNGAVSTLKDAMTKTESAMDALDPVGDSADAVLDGFSQSAETLNDAMNTLRQAVDSARKVVEQLADEPAIVVDAISDALADSRSALDASFRQLMDHMDDLNSAVSSTSDSIVSDLSAVNDQMALIVNTLRGVSEDTESPLDEDRYQDISDLDTGDRNGHITSSLNSGDVEGDVNAAGIVGSMAMEYDFDPEDDLVRSGSTSLNFRWQTLAVTAFCRNAGPVTVRNDGGGGITGRMDLGSVASCENYGPIASDSGDYVGGIAGSSTGVIRGSWARCTLSGGNYIGGIAGKGGTITDCHTLVEVEQGEACVGSIAGALEDKGVCENNTYIHDTLGGVDGISYGGQCDPIDFDTLAAGPDVPETWLQFQLTFVADGVTVAEIPFQYGDSLDALPEIPPKEGCTASWPDFDLDHLTFSRTLEAIYSFERSALSDDGNPPQVLVEGSFSDRAVLDTEISEQTWTDSQGGHHSGTQCAVTLADSSMPLPETVTVHWRLPEEGDIDGVWMLRDGTWQRVEFTRDGSYALFPADGSEFTFSVEPAGVSPLVWILAGAILLVVLLLLGLLARRLKNRRDKGGRRHHRRRKNRRAQPVDPSSTPAPAGDTPPDSASGAPAGGTSGDSRP